MKKVIWYTLLGAVLIAPNVVAVNGAIAADNPNVAGTLRTAAQLAENHGEGGVGKKMALCAGTGAAVGVAVFFPFGALIGATVGGIGCWVHEQLN